MSVGLGNDVVDLKRARIKRLASNEQFLERILSVREQQTVNNSNDPNLELWSHWAAKEAGFKAISKIMTPTPIFVHADFRISWSRATSPPENVAGSVIRAGSVSYHGLEADVTVALWPGRIHATAYALTPAKPEAVEIQTRVELLNKPNSSWAGSFQELRSRLSPQELDAVYSRESAAVRVGAREDLALLLRVEVKRVEIVCGPGPSGKYPPQVLIDGHPANADVSLSHDGLWIAWVVWADNLPGENS